MLKKGTKVKVLKSNDNDPEPMDLKYVGLTGIISIEGDGQSVETMTQVNFFDGDQVIYTDAFWNEELEKII